MGAGAPGCATPSAVTRSGGHRRRGRWRPRTKRLVEAKRDHGDVTTFGNWTDESLRPDLPSSEEREEIKRLRREVYELRRANEIIKAASLFFARELDADRPNWAATSTSIAAVSASSRSAGPWACLGPPITSAPRASARHDRSRTSGLLEHIDELHAANYHAYGYRRVWGDARSRQQASAEFTRIR
jgi:transposase-like protein